MQLRAFLTRVRGLQKFLGPTRTPRRRFGVCNTNSLRPRDGVTCHERRQSDSPTENCSSTYRSSEARVVGLGRSVRFEVSRTLAPDLKGPASLRTCSDRGNGAAPLWKLAKAGQRIPMFVFDELASRRAIAPRATVRRVRARAARRAQDRPAGCVSAARSAGARSTGRPAPAGAVAGSPVRSRAAVEVRRTWRVRTPVPGDARPGLPRANHPGRVVRGG
jgi:hypothetical protein